MAAMETAGWWEVMAAGLGLEAAKTLFKVMEPVGSLTATAVHPLLPGFPAARV